MSTKDLVYGAHVSLRCMNCNSEVDFVGIDYTVGNFREAVSKAIHESMVAHMSAAECIYEDEEVDKALFHTALSNIGGRLLLASDLRFARSVRMNERRRHKK